MDANFGEVSGGGIAVENALEGGRWDRVGAAEEERCGGGVSSEDGGEWGADGRFVDFFRLCGIDGIGRAVDCVAVKRLRDVYFGGGHVVGGKGEDFTFAATCKKEDGEKGGVHGGIDDGEKGVELLAGLSDEQLQVVLEKAREIVGQKK